MKVEVAVLGSPSLIVFMVSVDEKQHLNRNTSEVRSCVKADVAVLGSTSLIVLMVSGTASSIILSVCGWLSFVPVLGGPRWDCLTTLSVCGWRQYRTVPEPGGPYSYGIVQPPYRYAVGVSTVLILGRL